MGRSPSRTTSPGNERLAHAVRAPPGRRGEQRQRREHREDDAEGVGTEPDPDVGGRGAGGLLDRAAEEASTARTKRAASCGVSPPVVAPADEPAAAVEQPRTRLGRSWDHAASASGIMVLLPPRPLLDPVRRSSARHARPPPRRPLQGSSVANAWTTGGQAREQRGHGEPDHDRGQRHALAEWILTLARSASRSAPRRV